MNKGNENKNAEISARIAEILQHTGETRNSFAVKLGYERAQTVYDIMNMKSAPSYDFFRRFSVSAYSDTIDVRWLLSGRGSMLRSDQVQPTPQPAVQADAPGEAAAYYKMYEKKDAEVGVLKEEIGALKLKISQLEASTAEELAHPPLIEKVVDAFTPDSLGGSGKDFIHTRNPTLSKTSSASKI